jgi:hypothetical protein
MAIGAMHGRHCALSRYRQPCSASAGIFAQFSPEPLRGGSRTPAVEISPLKLQTSLVLCASKTGLIGIKLHYLD